jgi:tetraacyldisaccharide 4'-kinase
VNDSLKSYALDLISGRATGARAFALRRLLAAAEPFYAGAVRARNGLFDAGIKRVRRLDRPVISVGNITTGGTGKTPMVRWLAERLRTDGKTVAILSRGYRAKDNNLGDELTMLDRALNVPGSKPILIQASPDRFRAGTSLLREHPDIDVFLLDDGFQHRRVSRDFELVLISAIEPFGFGHMLPRGLLREPLAGLKRADAVVITHADQVSERQLDAIKSEIRKYNPAAAVYQAVHRQIGLRLAGDKSIAAPINHLSSHRFFAFCGIGSPLLFEKQLKQFGGAYAGGYWFGDHHQYSPSDMKDLARQAKAAGAESLVTTEKDWVKIESFACDMPVWRVEVQIQFQDEHERMLLGEIQAAMELPRAQ